MVEYVRLISKDSLLRITQNWDRQDTVILVAVLVTLVVIGRFVVGRK